MHAHIRVEADKWTQNFIRQHNYVIRLTMFGYNSISDLFSTTTRFTTATNGTRTTYVATNTITDTV